MVEALLDLLKEEVVLLGHTWKEEEEALLNLPKKQEEEVSMPPGKEGEAQLYP